MPYQASEHEHEVLKLWRETQAFQKSIDNRPADKPYVFYDGPPFATGLPHWGHISISTVKDVVGRFYTMKGFRVERRWGWDCHGLPMENVVEKDLNLKTKQDIEKFGIAKFNETCRSTVLRYADDWRTTIERIGRWVDMEHDYKTMDPDYMESVWWVFKQLWDIGLIYEGKKAMHVCPRCVTPLSNFEVTQGYKDIKDLSVTAQFKITSGHEKLNLSGDLYVLAWTTTPWTLPGNVFLAVGSTFEYVIVAHEGSNYVVAKERVEDVFDGKEYEVKQKVTGRDLVGLTYEPLFPYFAAEPDAEKAFRVVSAEFVTTEDGTGIVHIAPAFGQDDYHLWEHEGGPFIQHVTMEGKFIPEVTDFGEREVKPKDDHMSTDIEIIKWLAHNGKLFAKKKYEHSYPHCWRCDTPLLNYATSSWFVRVTELKDDLVAANDQINWVPDHIKKGRFGKWLEGVRDWAISRNRYWGAPLPIWKSEDGDIICIGSTEELEKLSGQKVEDLHKHIVDEITFTKDGKKYTRIPEVLDCWFEAGSMPYAQQHYPFENKGKFESAFPAEFIIEAVDQTRGWFYTLHVLATALTKNNVIKTDETLPAFRNVVVHGLIRAEDGLKMSKRLKNYTDPTELIEKYGADAARYYLMTSPVMHGEDFNFSDAGVRDVFNKNLNTVWNILSFYEMFADKYDSYTYEESENILDKWLVAQLHQLIKTVDKEMHVYDLVRAARPIQEFITEMSQWYVRRSRDRFKPSKLMGKGIDRDMLEKDKLQANKTLGYLLFELSKVMAPFTPFIAETMYQRLKADASSDFWQESVHLEDWPKHDENLIDEKVLADMEATRKLVEMGLSLRKDSGIRVRQPLESFVVIKPLLTINFYQLIKDELNVKNIFDESTTDGEWVKKTDAEYEVALNTTITDELKLEGLMREVVRAVNRIRKEKSLTISDRIVIEFASDDEILKSVMQKFADEIKILTHADEIKEGTGDILDICGHELKLNIISK